MVKYKITGIDYGIEPADVADEIDEDDYELRSDYLKACEDKIDEIVDSLPSEMEIEIEDEGFNGSVEDEIADVISDKTGWLVQSFNYARI